MQSQSYDEVAHTATTWASPTDGWLEPERNDYHDTVTEPAWTDEAGLWTRPEPAGWDDVADALEPESGWAHQPDPEATSTGFLVDWGDPAEHAADDEHVHEHVDEHGWATRVDTGYVHDHWTPTGDREADATPPPFLDAFPLGEPVPAVAETVLDSWAEPDVATIEPRIDVIEIAIEPAEFERAEVELATIAVPDFDVDLVDAPGARDDLVTDVDDNDVHLDAVGDPDPVDSVPAISWHPQLAELAAQAAVELSAAMVDEPADVEQWVVADDDWELGNALPLVEVRGQGTLVMRRADERWALANLHVSDRYVVEVDLEFRSGPGFGVLFRAAVDADGRMSAYSFDVDPVHEGGGYLVRQWQADRELWNPIAHVPAADVTTLHGALTVRLTIEGDRLVAAVDGTEVLTVDDLQQRSVERGRVAPVGDRVGVQAWSSSDLVVETLRVASR
jgi:hypothetical protein